MVLPHYSPTLAGADEKWKEWTSEKPTVPGWYWIRMNGCSEIVRVVVEKDTDKPCTCALLVPIEPAEGDTMDVEHMDVDWYGPLDIPATSSVVLRPNDELIRTGAVMDGGPSVYTGRAMKEVFRMHAGIDTMESSDQTRSALAQKRMVTA